jgi:glycosyltransferase involved in cell wall biosynthesis
VLVAHPGAHFSVADVYRGLCKGLVANGCEVGEFNLDDRLEFYARAHVKLDDGSYVKAFDESSALQMAGNGLEMLCYEWWPDVVVIVSGFFIPPKVWMVLRQRPHHVVYWCTESPYEDDRQSQAARLADTVILNDPTNLDAYRADVNKRTFYLPHSYDPAVHHPADPDPDLECDFAFVGTGFQSRVEWLEAVDWSGLDVRLAGYWQTLEDGSPLLPFLMHDRDQCIDNADTARLYRSARTSLNLYRKEHSDGAHADGWAMGPREVELAACGTFFFRESRGEGDELFPMLPFVTEPGVFGDALRWWLTRDEERREAAEAARAAIVDRTFTNTATRLLDLVGAGITVAA